MAKATQREDGALLYPAATTFRISFLQRGAVRMLQVRNGFVREFDSAEDALRFIAGGYMRCGDTFEIVD